MLTPTDIHILVGLLTRVSNPDAVEIMLGDLVYDVKAEKKRDVDVTVTHKDTNGIVSAFKGIEVKKHARPLDIIRVEQLCIKLNDMPGINHKAIVSASGYTQPARKKAEAHGVNLYSLIPWDNPMAGFEHVSFPPDFHVKYMTLTWAKGPLVVYNPSDNIPSEIRNKITDDIRIFGSIFSNDNNKTLKQLADKLSLDAVQKLINNEEIKALSLGIEKEVEFHFNDIGNLYIDLEGLEIPLKQALVKGVVVWQEQKLLPAFKILISVGESKPYVGCAIMEMPQGNLIGFTVSQVDRSFNLVNIPVSERNRKKIQKLQLK